MAESITRDEVNRIWSNIAELEKKLAVHITKFDTLATNYANLLIKYEEHLDKQNDDAQQHKNRRNNIKVITISGTVAVISVLLTHFLDSFN